MGRRETTDPTAAVHPTAETRPTGSVADGDGNWSTRWATIRRRPSAFIVGGLLVAFAVALLLSPEASTKPDGLNKVAIDQGFDGAERAHALDATPVAGYALGGIENERLATGLAGVIGVAVTFAMGIGFVWLARRRVNGRADAAPGAGTTVT